MAVFAIIAPSLDPRLEQAVKAHFEDGAFYKITPEQFLVSARGRTSQQIVDLLGAPGGNVGRIMVLRITNYAGWHTKDMWEWIGIHMAPPERPSSASEPSE